jgi:hypothetical protein
MTSKPHDRFLERFNSNPPADPSAIARFEKESGIRLPPGYSSFLLGRNGGEGFIGENAYVILWRLEELIALNKEYEVTEYVPGLLFIGSDGGGEAFALDRRASHLPIVSVPFVGMDYSVVRTIAPDISSFLEKLFNS